MKTLSVTAEAYAEAFARERVVAYPAIDAIEQACGFALDLERYLPAAAVLACPLKVNLPNWQHGRVLYAVARKYLAEATGPVQFLDIGTAKGFSALCLQWALMDAGAYGRVTSLDVMDPHGTDRRNTVAEVDGPKTLAEILAPWPESNRIDFLQSDGRKWLASTTGRVHLAFVDGKHTYDAVSGEASLIAGRQERGDVIVFDDVQIQAVALGVLGLKGYAVQHVDVLPNRRYVIARKT